MCVPIYKNLFWNNHTLPQKGDKKKYIFLLQEFSNLHSVLPTLQNVQKVKTEKDFIEG